jgi:hypothetical protein
MFLADTENSCPECHNRLVDEVHSGEDVKVCYSDICRTQCGDKGRVYKSFGWGDDNVD